jgi:hypothetical protein
LTRMMERDKFKGEYDAWFRTTPLGHQMELVEVKETGDKIKFNVRTPK